MPKPGLLPVNSRTLWHIPDLPATSLEHSLVGIWTFSIKELSQLWFSTTIPQCKQTLWHRQRLQLHASQSRCPRLFPGTFNSLGKHSCPLIKPHMEYMQSTQGFTVLQYTSKTKKKVLKKPGRTKSKHTKAQLGLHRYWHSFNGRSNYTAVTLTTVICP